MTNRLREAVAEVRSAFPRKSGWPLVLSGCGENIDISFVGMHLDLISIWPIEAIRHHNDNDRDAWR